MRGDILIRLIVLSLLAFCPLLDHPEAFAQTNSEVDREVIVMFKPNVLALPAGRTEATVQELAMVKAEVRNVLVQHGVGRVRLAFPNFKPADSLKVTPDGRVIKRNFAHIFVVTLSSKDERKPLITNLEKLAEVVYAEPNVRVILRSIPNVPSSEPDFDKQWNMHQEGNDKDIDAPEAWGIYTGSSTDIIAIIDDGPVKTTHEEFTGRVVGETSGNPGLHATRVAGIAAAKGNNNKGIAGLNWNAMIDTRTLGTSSTSAANAIIAAVDAGARVINDSWGQAFTDVDGFTFNVTLARAFAYAYKSNVLSCVAMPEQGRPEDYPNAYDAYTGGIVNVAATTPDDKKAAYSFPKNYVDVAAPGGVDLLDGIPSNDIYTTSANLGEKYAYEVGTSFATPHVTGLASLLIGYARDARGISLYNDDLENIIKFSAEKVGDKAYQNGWNNELGYGRINAHQALLRLHRTDIYDFNNQLTVFGGTTYSTDQTVISVYDVPGLLDGDYEAIRHEVRQSITFNSAIDVKVWGRGLQTSGWTKQDTLFGTGFCEVVPGSQTSTSAVLRTYVYCSFAEIS